MKKIISFALAFIMAAGGVLPCLFFKAEAVALGKGQVYEDLRALGDYTAIKYASPEEKLETMTLVTTKGDLELYIQEYTVEACIRNKKTGQMIFTNPYDVGYNTASGSIRTQLLSQIILSYYDKEGTMKELYSYSDAVENEQTTIKLIKDGVRIEYTIGAAVKKRIVPRQISKESFETKILAPFYENSKVTDTADLTFEEYMALKKSKVSEDNIKAEKTESFEFSKFLAFYQLFDASDPEITAREQAEMLDKYPITKTTPIYVIESKYEYNDKNLALLEGYISSNTEYSLDDMLRDHEEVKYELENQSPAIFNLALEYTLNDYGFQVRMPSRGLSFDSETYTLDNISILPYFGAGKCVPGITAERADERSDVGYNFIPDGSGATISFDKNKAYTKVSGTMYGNDFGFYKSASAATASYQTWRIPVYGTVMESTYSKFIKEGIGVDLKPFGKYEKTTVKQGYVAIITEGDSLTRIDSVNGGTKHDYHCVSTTIFPRQTDSYPLDGITVSGATAVYTKEIERRYVGNYTIQYCMLWGEDANYVGMANAYRDYLIRNGAIEKIANDNGDITLFLDLIGDIDVTKKYLGIPVEQKEELTSFEDARIIVQELLDSGITNQTIRYLGWVNGGMKYTAPAKLKVDKVLGGESGLKELIGFLQSKNIDIFMDLDFAYVRHVEMFDGYDSDDDSAKTIDGKAAFLREYNPVTQSFHSRVAQVVSPNTYSYFYGKINEKYAGLFGEGKKNISVGSLGNALNSSQDEDFPMNRENSKEYTVDILAEIDKNYDNVMVDNGNAYTWAYVNNILNIPLDSSNRNNISAEIPFMGLVLKEYVKYAGEAINLAGDYEFTILKTIENGACPYFVLAYENTEELKINGYGKYYAVKYDTWKESVIEEYKKINEALKTVSGSLVKAHDILENRVVRMTYDNGVKIYLNYNSYEATADGISLPAMGYKVVTK